MPGDVPRNLQQKLEQHDRAILNLERRRSKTTAWVQYGVVGPDWTFGSPWVTLDSGDVVQIGGWASDYTPVNGDLVAVMPYKPNSGQMYIVDKIATAALPYLNQLALPTASGFGRSPDATNKYLDPTFTKTSDGIVVFQGHVAANPLAAIPAGTVLATVPVGFRPDYDVVFPAIVYGGAVVGLAVRANGDVVLRSAITSDQSSYISLGNVAYPAAGAASWTNLTDIGSGMALLNGYTQLLSDANGDYGPVRFWRDQYGFIWAGGMLGLGTTSDSTWCLQLPDTFRGRELHHIVSTSNNVLGGLGSTNVPQATTAAAGLMWKASAQTSGWVSLAGCSGYEGMGATNVWAALPGAGGWQQYPGFAAAAMIALPNKLVRLKGLLQPTSGGANLFNVPAGYRPTQSATYTAGNPSVRFQTNSWANLEMNPNGGGWVTYQASTISWYSLDVQQYALGG